MSVFTVQVQLLASGAFGGNYGDSSRRDDVGNGITAAFMTVTVVCDILPLMFKVRIRFRGQHLLHRLNFSVINGGTVATINFAFDVVLSQLSF